MFNETAENQRQASACGKVDAYESEECREHRKREIGQAQCVHVLGYQELQDDEA